MSCLRDAARGAYERRWSVSSPFPSQFHPPESRRPRFTPPPAGPPPGQLPPYVIPPDEIVPGVASYYSTVCRECPAGCGLLAKNRDGRVIKLEGNPDHPVNAGALCIRGPAALQGLYHPDRFRGALVGGKAATWEDAEKPVVDKLSASSHV